MFRASLDTCVLVPDLRRDYILSLAANYTFAATWGSGVLFELGYVMQRLHVEKRDLSTAEAQAKVDHLLTEMRRAFPDSEVKADKGVEYSYDVADPDDRHVVHAAILGGVDALVSDDRKAKFEGCQALGDARIEVLKTPEFVFNTVSAHPSAAAKALREMADRRHLSPSGLTERLRSRGLSDAMDVVESLVNDGK